MLRRPPTTIKLTPEDIHDYDNSILQETHEQASEALDGVTNQRSMFSQNRSFKGDEFGGEMSSFKSTSLHEPGPSELGRLGASSPAQ